MQVGPQNRASTGTGGAPQWVAGAQKEGALVFNAGYVYRVKQAIANGQAAPTATNQYYLQLAYDDTAVVARLGTTTTTNPAAPVDSIPTASWGLQQVGTVFSLLRDATQIPLPAGTRNTFLSSETGQPFAPTSPVNATVSPYLGVKGGGVLTFSKPVAQTCFYDKGLVFISSAGTITASVVAPATAYYVRVVALTANGPDTGRTGVSSVYSTVTYSLDELPYVAGIQLPGGDIVRPNATGIVDGSQLGSGTPGTARDPYDVDTAKRKAVVDANTPLVVETDSAYYGKEFGDDVYGPGQPAYYKCISFAPAQTGGATVWKWARIDIL